MSEGSAGQSGRHTSERKHSEQSFRRLDAKPCFFGVAVITLGERFADRPAQTGPIDFLLEPNGPSPVGDWQMPIQPTAGLLSGSRDFLSEDMPL